MAGTKKSSHRTSNTQSDNSLSPPYIVAAGFRLLKTLAKLALALGALWAVLALWHLPFSPKFMGPTLAVCAVLVMLIGLTKMRSRWGYSLPIIIIVFAGALLTLATPSNDRRWSPDQERMPLAHFSGDEVTIENFRHAEYQSLTDYTVAWETRRYDLSKIQSVDYIVEPFSEWRALAHTFLTFGFSDGSCVAISIEIRKEKNEDYSPIAGLFRNYELYYVIGDERDLIGVRANIRRDPVYLFPIRATSNQVRQLFVSMLKRANHLVDQPEFYNSLANTCTTGVLDHMNSLRAEKIRHGWKTMLPGYSDAIALDLGLINAEGTLDELRERYLINNRSAPIPEETDGSAWSRQIRSIPAMVR